MYTEYKKGDTIIVGDSEIKVSAVKKGGLGVLYFGYNKNAHRNVIVKTVKRSIWEEHKLADVTINRERIKLLKANVFSSTSSLSFSEYILCTFFREGLIYMQLKGHQGFPAGYNIWETNHGQPFYEIEEIDHGTDLRGFVTRLLEMENSPRVSVLQCLHIGVSVCNSFLEIDDKVIPDFTKKLERDGVNFFIHRDIKPDNIMLTTNNIAKLIDFGNAKFGSQKENNQETDNSNEEGLTRMVMNFRPIYTPYFSSPQQLIGFRDLDQRADIYAFGATLCFLLTGSITQLMNRQLYNDIICIADIPAEVNQMVKKCLEYHPDQRFQSFRELKTELIRIISRIRDGSIEINENCKCSQCGYVSKNVLPMPEPELAPSPVEGLEFSRVAAGNFQKGCPPDFLEKILRKFPDVYHDKDFLRSFPLITGQTGAYEISVTPITNAQYHRFLIDSGYDNYPRHWFKHNQMPYDETKKNHPVVNVSFNDALKFCKFYGLRLPTGNEWEKAARGTNGQVYPWGNEFNPKYCNCAESKIYDTVDVNGYSDYKSPYNCLQMVGNVGEWIDESYPDNANYKYIVGGCYGDTCELFGLPYLRDSAFYIDERAESVGFRVARESVGPVPIIPDDAGRCCPICNNNSLVYFDVREISVPSSTNTIWGGYF